MKITSIEAIPFNLPPRRDFKWAGLAGSLGRFVLIRVRTDQGLVGYGEATPQPDWGGDYGRRNGETQLSVVNTVEESLAPALFGCDPLDVIAEPAHGCRHQGQRLCEMRRRYGLA